MIFVIFFFFIENRCASFPACTHVIIIFFSARTAAADRTVRRVFRTLIFYIVYTVNASATKTIIV